MDDKTLYRIPSHDPPECELIHGDFADKWRKSEEHRLRMLNDPEYRDKFNAATRKWMQART